MTGRSLVRHGSDETTVRILSTRLAAWLDLHSREKYVVSLNCRDMAFLATDLIELVPLDPDNETHVEVYRQSRNEPEMRATGSYGECDTRS